MPTVDDYRVGSFKMTRTMNSWLTGFPARLEQAKDELGETGMVKAAFTQYEVVNRAKDNCDHNNGKTIKNAVAAASKLNDMLINLEHEMRDRRWDAERSSGWFDDED